MIQLGSRGFESDENPVHHRTNHARYHRFALGNDDIEDFVEGSV